MARVVEGQQVMHWLCRRYFRFIFLGAISTCMVFNLALHSGTGLYFYCQEECLVKLIENPLTPLDPDVIAFIKSNLIDPPFPKGSFKPDFDIEKPPWNVLGKWGEAFQFIREYFEQYSIPGTFVEIGAQDGEFMSFTVWLEVRKGFEGLLIEPNPVDYPKLRAKKRAAYSANVCASAMSNHGMEELWLRDIPENLPPLLHRIQEGSNRLSRYVAVEDKELGRDTKTYCFNAAAIIKAALGTYVIDFLSISTHGGELDILASIPSKLKIRMLAIVAPLATGSEYEDLKKLTDSRGLAAIRKLGNMHIFIPENEITVQVADSSKGKAT